MIAERYIEASPDASSFPCDECVTRATCVACPDCGKSVHVRENHADECHCGKIMVREA